MWKEVQKLISALKPSRLPKKYLCRGLLALAGMLVTSVLLYFMVAKPLLAFVGDTERFRAWVDQSGVWGRIGFIGMVALQIIIAFIPGEPLEIAAGFAFGAIEGTALCMLGALIGGTTVFLMVRRFGRRFAEAFVPRESMDGLCLLKDTKRTNLTIGILFLIPGTPKDVMTYFAGLTKIRLKTWMAVTSLARFPSIITSTLGGNALGMRNYVFAILVFAATLLLTAAGVIIYKRTLRQ